MIFCQKLICKTFPCAFSSTNGFCLRQDRFGINISTCLDWEVLFFSDRDSNAIDDVTAFDDGRKLVSPWSAVGGVRTSGNDVGWRRTRAGCDDGNALIACQWSMTSKGDTEWAAVLLTRNCLPWSMEYHRYLVVVATLQRSWTSSSASKLFGYALVDCLTQSPSRENACNRCSQFTVKL